MKRFLLSLKIFFILALACSPCASTLLAQSKTYTFIELAPLTGDLSSAATSLNHTGQIVGYSANAEGKKRAVLWTLGGKSPLKPVLLPDLGGGFSEAFDINDLGEISGQSSTAAGQAHACVWNRYRAISDLHTLFSSPTSTAMAINNKQDIAGYRVNAKLEPSILIIRQGTVEDWSDKSSLTRASDINSLRVASANAQDGETNSAFSIKGHETAKLSTPSDKPLAEVTSLNISGQKAGSCSSDETQVAVFWPDDSQPPVVLGTLGGPYSKSLGINSFAAIVGASNLSNTTAAPAGPTTNNSGFLVSQVVPLVNELDRAFLWKSGSLSNLNQLTTPPKNCILQAASGINDFGEIVGYCNLSGNLRGFALLPTARITPTLSAFPSRSGTSYPKLEPVEIWLVTNVKTKEIRLNVDGVERAVYSSIPYPLTIANLSPGSHTLQISIKDPANKKITVTWTGSVTVE